MKKFLKILAGAAVAALVIFVYFRFFFVFGEGVRNGELNYVVYKGVIFKTYEGKLIQTGLRSQSTGGGIQSNTFDFSVADKNLAEKLMRNSGKILELHYKEYFGKLPWRGHTKYVVDEIISISDKNETIDEGTVKEITAI